MLPLLGGPGSEGKGKNKRRRDADRHDAKRRGMKHRNSRNQKRKRRRKKRSGDSGGGSGSGGDGAGPIDTSARRPFPRHVSYAGGTIRPNHRDQSQLDDDVRAASERWKQRYLVAVGSAQYRVAFGKPGNAEHDTTVSEGQGYGMVIVPLLAGHDPQARAIFDGLWRYALAYRSCGEGRLMLWKIPNASFGCASANDGDLDIAYGLLLADAQWGSDGAIDYRAAANGVLAGILASAIGPQSRLPLLGDWVNLDGDPANQWTPRTSDLMTGHFRTFGRATGNSVWHDVAEKSLDVVQTLQEEHSPGAGLLPDFVEPVSDVDHAPRPARPHFLEGANDGAYNYNAGRDPWRLGTDGLLNGDPRALAALAALAKFSSWAGYALDGDPLASSDYFTSFFAAPLGVAAMASPSRQAWLNAIYGAVRQREENYYEDSVCLLCMLVMTGNFWDPTS